MSVVPILHLAAVISGCRLLIGFCQDSQFPINFCESETCQCKVGLEIQKETSIVAGDGAHLDVPGEAVDGDPDDGGANRNCGLMQHLKPEA